MAERNDRGRSSGGQRSSSRDDRGRGRDGGGRGRDGSSRGRDDRGRGRDEYNFSRDDRPDTRTDAQKKSAEVKRRTGGRRVKEQPATAPERREERWIDEGPVRRAAKSAVKRGAVDGRGARKPVRQTTSPDRKKARKVADSVHAQFVTVAGPRRANRLSEQFAEATIAFDRDRVEDARKMLNAMGREALTAPCVHELMGLIRYRLGEWKKAIVELEAALQTNRDSIEHLPVLADCYRALGNHSKVVEIWDEIREQSPHPEVMAEGRIVMAGSFADRRELKSALALMERSGKKVKPVRDYNLREWYFLADLYDRSGDPINARKYFGWVAENDPDFVDVLERLASLGG